MAFTYIDPDNGNNANDGLSELTPKLTGAHIDWSSANNDYQIYIKGNTTNWLEYTLPTSGARSARIVISIFPSEVDTGIKAKFKIIKNVSSSVTHSGFTFIDLEISDLNTATGNSGFQNGYCLRCNLDMSSMTQNSTNVSPFTYDYGTITQPNTGTIYWNPQINCVVKEVKMVNAYGNAGNIRHINSVYIMRDAYTGQITNAQTFYNCAIVYRTTSAATTGSIFSTGYSGVCINTHVINLKNNNRPIQTSALNAAYGSLRTYGINLTNFVDNGMGGATNITSLTDEFESTTEAGLQTTYMKIKATSGAVDAGIGGADIGWAVLSSGGSLLPIADVKIGVDRGDGNLGTYDGSDRWSDAGESNVKFGVQYKANSLTNNKTGNRTDANPTNVKTGTGTYGANGTEFTPSYSPDFASPSNVLENDTTDGVTGTIPLSAVKATSGGTLALNKIAPSQGGSYLGEESNDSISAAELKIGLTKQNLGNTINGTYDAVERYTDLDLSKVDSTYSFRFNSLTNNRTGTKVFYPLLPITDVKINVDRGDGQIGTYVAAERYTDIDLSQVTFGYAFRYNSLTNNRVGTRTSIYPLLPLNKVESGTDRGDGQLGTNKGEAFNSVLTPSLIKVGESIENLGETILGDYTASERYTQLLPEEVQNNKEYIYNNEEFTGTLTGGSIDPKYILTPFGTLGEINLSSMDYAKQARNQFLTVMSANLTGWKQADYLELDGLTKNSNVQNAKRYGIRILGNEIITGPAGVIGREVVSREFEIVLTDSFINNQTTDLKARDCQDKIIEEMEKVRRFINSTNFGLFSVPRIITDISEDNCEFIDENNTVVCRMRLKVQLKLNKS